jgi:hypothetical protein
VGRFCKGQADIGAIAALPRTQGGVAQQNLVFFGPRAEMYARYDPQALRDFASVEKSISKRFKINARDMDADAKFIEEIIQALDGFVDSLDPNAHLDGQVAKLRAERAKAWAARRKKPGRINLDELDV